MNTKFSRLLLPIAAIAALALGGCVVAPNDGYGYGYYGAPVVVAPPVVVGGEWGWGGGWRGGEGHGHWR